MPILLPQMETFQLNGFIPVGPAEQVGVYGYGISQWGGYCYWCTELQLLNGALSANAYGTGGSGTSITVASVPLDFQVQEQIILKWAHEEISYTGITSGLRDLTGITRACKGHN